MKHNIEFHGRENEKNKWLCTNDNRENWIEIFVAQIVKLIFPQKADLIDQLNYSFVSDSMWIWNFFLEIGKNIYDHNGGFGYADIEIRDDLVFFEIGNLENPTPETNEHQPDSRVNFGWGLEMTNKMAKTYTYEYSLDAESKYVHKGSCKIPKVNYWVFPDIKA